MKKQPADMLGADDIPVGSRMKPIAVRCEVGHDGCGHHLDPAPGLQPRYSGGSGREGADNGGGACLLHQPDQTSCAAQRQAVETTGEKAVPLGAAEEKAVQPGQPGNP
ncbi:hypothetical protein D3C75_900460 [compost metagenome]